MNKVEYQKKIEETTSLKEKIKLEGKLITQIKNEIKKCKDPLVKQNLRLELYEELKKHKETTKNIKSSEKKEFSLPERIALKVQEIATSINIWSEKHDVIEKLKGGAISTVFSTITCLGMGMGISLISGGTLTLPTLASIIPLASYVGLSNILKIPFTKTAWEEFLDKYENREEIAQKTRTYMQEKVLSNHTYLELANKKTTCKTLEEKIEVTEKLLPEMKKILEDAPVEEIKYVFHNEYVNLIKELKGMYTKKKEQFLLDNGKLTSNEFIELEKKSLKLDSELFIQENHVKETSKEGIKNFAKDTAIMYAVRAALSVIFPQYAIQNMSDALTPFIISLINNVTNIHQIRDKIKLKESKYVDQIIKFKNSNAAERLVHKEENMEISRGIA